MARPHRVDIEPSPRRVRALFAGATVADSTNTLLVRETGYRPVYYFPFADIAAGLLAATDHHTRCPYKGEASYWTISANGRTADNAAWGYPEPIPAAAALKDHVAFYWDRLDHWYEEDEEIFVHPRDPHVRVDVVASRRRVQVRHAGVVLADTRQALFLFETGLPTRHYIPPADIRTDLLAESAAVTRCPYKGIAAYRSAVIDGRTSEDIAWVYEAPIAECPRIAGHICFFAERVDEIRIDGVAVLRPDTPWSRPRQSP